VFYYFGSKARIAKNYPAPIYPLLIEPFAGSAGYACRYPDRQVILYEKDPRVAALWETLRKLTPDEIKAIPTPVVGTKTSDLLTMLRGASEHSLTDQYMTVTARMVSRWPHLLQRIASLSPQIAHWQIFNEDYQKAPDVEATWFVDPPYQKLTRGYAYRNLDYGILAQWCRSRRGQVIVCEQAGADWLPFKPLKNIITTNGSRKTEVIWEKNTDE